MKGKTNKIEIAPYSFGRTVSKKNLEIYFR